MKNFFRITKGKVTIFTILFFLTIFIPRTTQICSMTPDNGVVCGKTEAQGIGYPVVLGTQYFGDHGSLGVHPLNFLLNLIIFYPLSCALLLITKRIATKGK